MTHKKQFGFSSLLLCVAPLSHGIPKAADKHHRLADVYLTPSHDGSRALTGLGVWARVQDSSTTLLFLVGIPGHPKPGHFCQPSPG